MVDLGTPQDWAQGGGAIKNGVDALRGVVQLIRDVTSGNKPAEQQRKAIDLALEEAEKAAKLADAQTAKALGYTLCHCEFPSVAMLTAGRHNARGREGPVHECPRCGYNDADPWMYTPIAPPRDQRK
jgi:hypothetical protein